MRERKTVKIVGRNQFALLLRALNISSELMRNKRLLSTHSVSIKRKTSISSEFHIFYNESTSSSSIAQYRERRKKKKVKITNKK